MSGARSQLMLTVLAAMAAGGDKRAAATLAHHRKPPRAVNEAERDAKRAKRLIRGQRRHEKSNRKMDA